MEAKKSRECNHLVDSGKRELKQNGRLESDPLVLRISSASELI